jgi:hypothetical protein
MGARIRNLSDSRYPLGIKDAIAAFFSPRVKISTTNTRSSRAYVLERRVVRDFGPVQPANAAEIPQIVASVKPDASF